MQRFLRRVAVIGGARIPFCRSNTFYADLSNLDLMTGALNALVDRYNLKGQHIDEVVGGAVVTHSKDFNLTREAVLGTRLKASTPGITMMQACGTSLQGGLGSAAKIATGEIECAIAVGSDTTSDAPIVVSKKLAKRLTQAAQQKTFMDKLKVFRGFSPGELAPMAPANAEPRTGLSMGDHAAITALKWGISRADQDALALASHQRLASAYANGFFDDLVTPYLGLAKDQNLRADTTIEKLAKLKPVFGSEEATMTAGNSSPLTDGASTVLLAGEEWAEQHKLPVQAWFVDAEDAAVDFVHGEEGLLMAPAYAVPRLLARNGLTLQDFDFYEIHEAFASQVLATLAAWESPSFCKEKLGLDAPLGSIDRAKLNVNGSSLAAGHPFAATGGRIVATLAKLLAEKGEGRGLISICAAGGQGVVAILER